MASRILVAVIGVPVLLLVFYVLPPIWTAILVALLSMIASYEAGRALRMPQPRIRLYGILLAGCVPFWVFYGQQQLPALCGMLVFVVLVFIEAMASNWRVKLDQVGGVFFFSLFISYLLSSIVRIGQMELRVAYILLPIMIPFLTDAAAMLTGMFLGRHQLAPRLSPKKTVEGCLGGFVGGIVPCLIYGLIIHQALNLQANYLLLALYGLLGAAISQIGDLSFSYVKRQNKMKDYGSIFLSHGGVLDRFDSVIFCAPLVEILICLLPVFS